MGDVTLRYAETDDDVIHIHQFLCVVAAPFLPARIDPIKSIEEVWRVVKHDVALMAMRDGDLVGTIGLINPAFWWNQKAKFLANRWFFTLPRSRCGRMLLTEARAIAKGSNLELHIYSEERGTLTIFNKSKQRHVLRQQHPDDDEQSDYGTAELVDDRGPTESELRSEPAE